MTEQLIFAIAFIVLAVLGQSAAYRNGVRDGWLASRSPSHPGAEKARRVLLRDGTLRRCEATLTVRYPRPRGCRCKTYDGNLGPCAEHALGQSGRCVYCDHELSCEVRP